jgi:hypothetical protein
MLRGGGVESLLPGPTHQYDAATIYNEITPVTTVFTNHRTIASAVSQLEHLRQEQMADNGGHY